MLLPIESINSNGSRFHFRIAFAKCRWTPLELLQKYINAGLKGNMLIIMLQLFRGYFLIADKKILL